ncbi:unnamed protein product [Polarella glacialis]|uniref:Phytase-like domain-containing protein n=2 Tax=Polarella glacialis TaxID=89957 RepID=A0A813JW26_POLGL|nr:unnamed protein product [Polarella glacialis]
MGQDDTVKLRFAGVDHVSHIRVPHGTTFQARSGQRGRVFGVSAIALEPVLGGPPGNTSEFVLLALCDRSRILAGRVALDSSGARLQNITWTDQWEIVSDGPGHEALDAEGLVILPQSREVLVSTEPGPVYRLPPMRDWQSGTQLRAVELETLPDYIMAGVSANEGLESLTAVPLVAGTSIDNVSSLKQLVVTALEGQLVQDAASVKRLYELDAATGSIRFQAFLLVDANEPRLLLSELVALDAEGLAGGGQFLALERGWSVDTGSDIRLYLLDAAGADDVAQCQAIVEDTMASLPACPRSNLTAVSKRLIFRWTKDAQLAGLPVDNYEGMVLVPPSALGPLNSVSEGGVMLLLVNDDNDNPAQIGTQFVLLRLAFDSSDAGLSQDPSSQRGSLEFAVVPAVIVVAVLLLLAAVWRCRRLWRASGRQLFKGYRREELEEDDPPQALEQGSGTDGPSILGHPAVDPLYLSPAI